MKTSVFIVNFLPLLCFGQIEQSYSESNDCNYIRDSLFIEYENVFSNNSGNWIQVEYISEGVYYLDSFLVYSLLWVDYENAPQTLRMDPRLGKLTSLREIDLTSSQDLIIPGSIKNLDSLIGLWIDAPNCFNSLPNSVIKCKSLNFVSLLGNTSADSHLPRWLVKSKSVEFVSLDLTLFNNVNFKKSVEELAKIDSLRYLSVTVDGKVIDKEFLESMIELFNNKGKCIRFTMADS